MSDARKGRDRRKETRNFAAGLINWHNESTREDSWGLMSDDSASSVSFITGAKFEPMLGDQIEVRRSDAPKRQYCVTRVALYDQTLLLVAGVKAPN